MPDVHRTGVILVVGRTRAKFSTRDKVWTDDDGVTHRLVGFRRIACNPYLEMSYDLRDKTPWRESDCIGCLAESFGNASWAVLQEATWEEGT